MCVYGVAPDITGRFVLFVFKKKKKKVEQSSTTVCKCFYIMFERLDATSQARPAALH